MDYLTESGFYFALCDLYFTHTLPTTLPPSQAPRCTHLLWALFQDTCDLCSTRALQLQQPRSVQEAQEPTRVKPAFLTEQDMMELKAITVSVKKTNQLGMAAREFTALAFVLVRRTRSNMIDMKPFALSRAVSNFFNPPMIN